MSQPPESAEPSRPETATASPPTRFAIWKGGITATFLSGLFAILPIMITVAIVGWVAQKVLNLVGPGTRIGSALESVGLQFVTDRLTALLIGWAVVLAGIWLLGLLVKTRARQAFDRLIDLIVRRIPFVKGVYGTASQVIGMLEQKDEGELKGMSVVFCDFGQDHGAGFLCLLATPDVFQFESRDYRFVYMPTSPIPMTGGIILVPAESVRPVNMSVDKLLEIYFSMGVLAPHAVPAGHKKQRDES